jgi:hypothetical protein
MIHVKVLRERVYSNLIESALRFPLNRISEACKAMSRERNCDRCTYSNVNVRGTFLVLLEPTVTLICLTQDEVKNPCLVFIGPLFGAFRVLVVEIAVICELLGSRLVFFLAWFDTLFGPRILATRTTWPSFSFRRGGCCQSFLILSSGGSICFMWVSWTTPLYRGSSGRGLRRDLCSGRTLDIGRPQGWLEGHLHLLCGWLDWWTIGILLEAIVVLRCQYYILGKAVSWISLNTYWVSGRRRVAWETNHGGKLNTSLSRQCTMRQKRNDV